MADVEAYVEFGAGKFGMVTLDNVLIRVNHVRGFTASTSYCTVEIGHQFPEVLNQLQVGVEFRVCYGQNGINSDWFHFKILHVDNALTYGSTAAKVIGVEPAFLSLSTGSNVKSFPNSLVSEVVSELATGVGLSTEHVKQTSGVYTYIQPNISDLQMLLQYLLPIATDTGGAAPYLMTINEGKMWFKPPSLLTEPLLRFMIQTTKDQVIKSFKVKNNSVLSDYLDGYKHTSYSYDNVQKGFDALDTSMPEANDTYINNIPYSSNFQRSQVLPYDEKWMVRAHTKNHLARSQFVTSVQVKLLGTHKYSFDQITQFSIPVTDLSLKEYSGKYYIYGTANVLERRNWHSYLSLRSNAFLRGMK